MTQDQVFWQDEGDGWFNRNGNRLSPEGLVERDPILRLLADHPLNPKTVVEVGAANGYRLEALRRRHHCACTAIDPSQAALENGRRQFTAVRFLRGMAHHLPELPVHHADLVLVSFVLHWVDRARLLASVAELDRVLADGGHLVIADFLPDTPQRVRYHHRPQEEVWTYKQDYALSWMGSGLYREIDRRQVDHRTGQFSDGVPAEERAVVVLLRKALHEGYSQAALPGSVCRGGTV